MHWQPAPRSADEAFQDPEVAFNLSFLHQAQTSIDESDYSPAFVDAWFVIEHWIHSQWRDALAAAGICNTKIKKLLLWSLLTNQRGNGLGAIVTRIAGTIDFYGDVAIIWVLPCPDGTSR